jgi:hypothetical protein
VTRKPRKPVAPYHERHPEEFAQTVLDTTRIVSMKKHLKLANDLYEMLTTVIPVLERVIEVEDSRLKIERRKR